MSELAIPSGATSIAAIGATKDGAIVARALVGDATRVFVYLPMAQFGFPTGWTDIGRAAATEIPISALSHSLGAYAAVTALNGSAEYTLALASGYEQCGTGAIEQLPQASGGWVTSVQANGVATGALFVQGVEDATMISFRASVNTGLQLIALPFEHTSSITMDANSSGWVVGLSRSQSGWGGVVAVDTTLQTMTGRLRNVPNALVNSCVGIGEDFTIVANVQTSATEYRVALLTDARADHVPTGIVDFDDLAGYLIDYSDHKPTADVDASGSVTCSDCDEYIALWIDSQIDPVPVSMTVDALPLYALLMRVLTPESVPQTIRDPAISEFENSVHQFTAQDPTNTVTAEIGDDCAHVPYTADPTANWCGSSSIDVPDFIPHCCADHDNCYRGFPPGLTNDIPPRAVPPGGRRGCDDRYLLCMTTYCSDRHDCPFAWFGCRVLAGIYHLGVQLGGWSSYCACLRHLDPEGCAPQPTIGFVGAHGSAVLP